MLAVVLLAFDEGSTRNEDIRAVFNAFLERAPKTIKETMGNAQERLAEELKEVAKQSALSDFWGMLGEFDPDKTMTGNAPSGHFYPAGELQFLWERDRGDGWFRADDSCDLAALRVVGYTPSGQRIVLLDNKLINRKLEANGQFSIPLPVFLFAPPPRVFFLPDTGFLFPVRL